MKLIFSIILIFFLSCSSVKYSAVSPAESPITKWNEAPSQDKINKMFYLAEGIQTLPHVISSDLGNGLMLYYHGFDYKAEEESYTTIKKSIISDFNFSGKFIEYENLDLPSPSKSYTFKEQIGKNILNISLAIVPAEEKGLIGILIIDLGNNSQEKRDEILSTVAFHGIPNHIVKPLTDTSVKLADHSSYYHSCAWRNIRNLSCYSNGQMNWSLNSTLSLAKNMANAQFDQVISNTDFKVLLDDSIDVLFLEKPAKMRRVVLAIENLAFKLFVPSSNVLYTYSVTSKIDSAKYINWLDSHYEDQASNHGVPYLLGGMFSYKNKPKSRIFSEKTFPSLDTLKLYLEKEISEPISFTAKRKSDEEVFVEISTEYIDTVRFSIFTQTTNSEHISLTKLYLDKVENQRSESVKKVRERLSKTSSIVQFEYLKESNKLEDLVYRFCAKNIAGMYQVDYRGFFLNRQLAYRLK